MIIDFNKMPEEAISGFKGGKKEFDVKMFTDDSTKIMQGRLQPGASIGLHTHPDTAEIMFFTAGSGIAICNGKEEAVGTGICHYCPLGSEHTLRNTGDSDLCFFAVVPKIGPLVPLINGTTF